MSSRPVRDLQTANEDLSHGGCYALSHVSIPATKERHATPRYKFDTSLDYSTQVRRPPGIERLAVAAFA